MEVTGNPLLKRMFSRCISQQIKSLFRQQPQLLMNLCAWQGEEVRPTSSLQLIVSQAGATLSVSSCSVLPSQTWYSHVGHISASQLHVPHFDADLSQCAISMTIFLVIEFNRAQQLKTEHLGQNQCPVSCFKRRSLNLFRHCVQSLAFLTPSFLPLCAARLIQRPQEGQPESRQGRACHRGWQRLPARS